MIITIDTTKDSKEEMFAAAKILNELAGNQTNSVTAYDTNSSESTGAVLGDMFGSYDNNPDDNQPPPKPSSDVEILTY